MPTSDNQGKFLSFALINAARPQGQVWDIGPGEGTYADLVLGTAAWAQPCWIAVEIWAPYIEKYDLHRKYDVVLNQDARTLKMDNVKPDSLIIFGDVLEHMPEDDARALILKAKGAFRYILVSIPIVHAPQGEVNGNPYEEHVKHWDFDEMHAAMGYCMAFKGHTIGLYWWDGEEDV